MFRQDHDWAFCSGVESNRLDIFSDRHDEAHRIGDVTLLTLGEEYVQRGDLASTLQVCNRNAVTEAHIQNAAKAVVLHHLQPLALMF